MVNMAGTDVPLFIKPAVILNEKQQQNEAVNTTRYTDKNAAIALQECMPFYCLSDELKTGVYVSFAFWFITWQLS